MQLFIHTESNKVTECLTAFLISLSNHFIFFSAQTTNLKNLHLKKINIALFWHLVVQIRTTIDHDNIGASI